MKMGIVGLGRMGAGITERLRRDGHEVVGYDRNPAVSEVRSLEALVQALEAPRTVWVMVPAGDPTQATIDELADLLSPGDILIDGGNSYYKDSARRAGEVAAKGIKFMDSGTFCSIWGPPISFCLMVGGQKDAFDHAEPI